MPPRRVALAAACLLSSAALVVAALPQATAAEQDGPGYRVHDYADGQAMSILPPGENGLVNATDLLTFETMKKRPPYSDDQLSKYANLLYGYHSLTDGTLGRYYDDESFGVRPGDVTRTEKPETGVTVYRDQHDVPHIYGSTDAAAAFGAGYTQAEDRLFLMDVLRHYGEGTLASFLGSSCEFEQMDHDELLLAPYTKARAEKQIQAMAASHGTTGRRAKTMLDNYVAGVNAYISKATLDPSLLPADYGAAVGLPQKWSTYDVVAIAGLIGGIFGRGGGAEMADANLLEYLQHRYGDHRGARMYREINHQDDPSAPTTVTDRVFRYDLPTAAVHRSLTALPDYRKALTGGPVSTSPSCTSAAPSAPTLSAKATRAEKAQVLASNIVHALDAMPQHMSNALVVNGSHTRSGHPIAVFGPQVSYFAPEILSLEEIQSPHYSAEGASFPGTGLVELGRGRDYAWSATSAGSDVIDQRVEKVCNPTGGAPAAQGTFYLYKGRCRAMVHETYSETAVPKPGGIGAPVTLRHDIYRTRHGVVQGWTTVRGKPVAIVNQRSTYNHDIDSVIGFLQYGEPGYVHDVHSWMRAASHINYTFNWFYVDNRDTGYFVSGADPRRNPHADTSLPTWGTGAAEWRGFLRPREHVHEVDPKQGFFVSWNNKPAPGQADDGGYAYGQTYRSVLLVKQLRKQLRRTHDKVTRADVVKAMETAASQDLDGVEVMPLLLKYVHGHHHTVGVASMLHQLRSWATAGAHRLKAHAGDAEYAHHAAIAISDELMPDLITRLYGRILGGQGTGGVASTGGATVNGFATVPMQWVNTPNSGGSHLGSAYDGGFEGYVMSTLQQLLGRHPRDGFSAVLRRHECDGGASTCRRAVEGALNEAYQALVKANGTTDVSAWSASSESAAAKESMPVHDSIAFRALGIVGQPNIDWQNRPTFQQVVEFPRHRAR
ncbi:penicillin acylase family protein [Nocardioides terrisoli]|uniref:penicillin acylase family protein n=1 Tax=Nocardioides terrisoli TaxID=3388267 RepID=UPI00287BA43B|nr:penicillin acylase family protein [Nocardioides marmorisolisilvae]